MRPIFQCTFSVQFVNADSVIIHDENVGMSVTNDAEAVVRNLYAAHVLEDRELIYRDSAGRYDQLKHDGRGNFTGFRPLDELAQRRVRQVLDGSLMHTRGQR